MGISCLPSQLTKIVIIKKRVLHIPVGWCVWKLFWQYLPKFLMGQVLFIVALFFITEQKNLRSIIKCFKVFTLSKARSSSLSKSSSLSTILMEESCCNFTIKKKTGLILLLTKIIKHCIRSIYQWVKDNLRQFQTHWRAATLLTLHSCYFCLKMSGKIFVHSNCYLMMSQM